MQRKAFVVVKDGKFLRLAKTFSHRGGKRDAYTDNFQAARLFNRRSDAEGRGEVKEVTIVLS